jgi:hypothetical protein
VELAPVPFHVESPFEVFLLDESKMSRKSTQARAAAALQQQGGYVLDNDVALHIARQTGQRPGWSCIPCPAVRIAIEKFGYGSLEHVAEAEIASQAMQWYIDGKAWPDPIYWPSPQEKISARTEFELGMGGAKGGGKSFMLLLFMIFGNFYADPDNLTMVDRSYIHHKDFLGLILRRTEKDMLALIDIAIQVYSGLGGVWIKEESRFIFAHSGATIGFGHYDGPETYAKYFGRNIVRLGIDEAIQIRERSIYMNLRSCIRSPSPEMRAQMLSTFNPRGGPGVRMIFDRFIVPKRTGVDGRMIAILGPDGQPVRAFTHDWTPIYPEPPIREEIPEEIYIKARLPVPPLEQRVATRAFIPATLADNPHLLHNPDYINVLATLDQEDREAYLMGTWDDTGGAYFSGFRSTRQPQEPENACHVLQVGSLPPGMEGLRKPAMPVELIPAWWPRHMGGDWGFDHNGAFYTSATNPQTSQVNVYRERVFKGTIPETGGVLLGMDAREDLIRLRLNRIQCAVGMDAEANRIGPGRSVVELLAKGAGEVLGSNAVHIPDFIIAKMSRDASDRGETLGDSVVAEVRQLCRTGLVFVRAINDRVIGWQLIRSMLRWAPHEIEATTLSKQSASEILKTLVNHGRGQMQERLQDELKMRQVEVLPALQLYSVCERLIDAFPAAQKREKNPEDVSTQHFDGLDSLDGLRYLIMLATSERSSDFRQSQENLVEMAMSNLTKDCPNLSTRDTILSRLSLENRAKQELKQEGRVVSILDPMGARRQKRRQTVADIITQGGLRGIR